MTADKNLDHLSEAELAEFYEQHKGDMSLWRKTARPLRRRRGEGPSTSFAIRLTPEEIEELQEAARGLEVTLSDFVRSAALDKARFLAGQRSDAVREMRAWLVENAPGHYRHDMTDREVFDSCRSLAESLASSLDRYEGQDR